MKSKATDGEIQELFGQGLGAVAISRQLGMSASRVTRRIQRMGLSRSTSFVPDSRKLDLVLTADPKNGHKAAEHFAKFWFTLRGCEIFQPESDSSVDLLVQIDGSLRRVQVKSSRATNNCGNLTFSLSRRKINTRGNKRVRYTEADCDFFFLFGLRQTQFKVWLIPFKILKSVGDVAPEGKYPGFQIW